MSHIAEKNVTKQSVIVGRTRRMRRNVRGRRGSGWVRHGRVGGVAGGVAGGVTGNMAGDVAGSGGHGRWCVSDVRRQRLRRWRVRVRILGGRAVGTGVCVDDAGRYGRHRRRAADAGRPQISHEGVVHVQRRNELITQFGQLRVAPVQFLQFGVDQRRHRNALICSSPTKSKIRSSALIVIPS